MNTKIALSVATSATVIILVIGALFFVDHKSHADQLSQNDQVNMSSYMYCVPKNNTGPTWSYPDGIHAVETPPDPAVVNGQQQIQTTINKMKAQENIVAKDGPQTLSRDESILSSYKKQYDSLVAQYDDCSTR